MEQEEENQYGGRGQTETSAIIRRTDIPQSEQMFITDLRFLVLERIAKIDIHMKI